MLLLLIVIIIVLCVLGYLKFIRKGSLFIKSFVPNMDITENPETVQDQIRYFDNSKPIYYNFVPDVEPMA